MWRVITRHRDQCRDWASPGRVAFRTDAGRSAGATTVAQHRSGRHPPTMADNPTTADFWNTRYASARTPWDYGAVPPPLARYLATHPGRGLRVLIPGCGSGYEIAAFARAGYLVTAVDFSTAAVARARQNVGPALADRVIEGDFF